MYLEFFGLAEKPFSQTPDPRFLYWNDSYREALASLRYGIQERKGFLTFIGEAGTGKTTLLRKLLEELGPDVLSVFLFNPDVGFEEILQYTLGELGIACPSQRRLDMLQRLNEFLLAAYGEGRNTVLLIDEAQDLDSGVLESLRLLSNLETARDKILQIVLCGQPELARRLAQPNLRQLKQRIAVRCRLEPLRRAEIPDYVATRTRIAGAAHPIFDESCMQAIWDFSGGIPRLVNMACDNALLVAYAVGKRQVDAEVLDEVVHDLSRLDVMDLSEDFLDPEPEPAPRAPARPVPAMAASLPPPPATRREDPVVPAGGGWEPAAPSSMPVAQPPRPAEDPGGIRPPSHRVADLPPLAEPAVRVTSLRWVPWLALAGVVLSAVLAANLLRRPRPLPVEAPSSSTPTATEGAPDPSNGLAAAERPDPREMREAPVAPRFGAEPAPAEPGKPSADLQASEPRRAVPGDDASAPPPTMGSPVESPRPTDDSSPRPTDGSALGPLENRRAVVRRGDTLSNLAKEIYGTESLTMLDILGRANPDLVDLDHIEPGQSIFFPEPRPSARLQGGGSGTSLLVATTRDRVAADRIRSSLPSGLLGLSTVEPGRLGSLRVYRVVVRDLAPEGARSEAAERLGPVFGPGSLESRS